MATTSATISPGLCASCMSAKRIVSAKGSVFWMCTHAKRRRRGELDEDAPPPPDPPKYPPLPVLRCRHHSAIE